MALHYFFDPWDSGLAVFSDLREAVNKFRYRYTSRVVMIDANGQLL